MNEQRASSKSSIEWTRIKKQDGTFRRGFTWNPIAGCKHECKWSMPNGEIAICYAENVAENGMAKTAYPYGFGHHYWKPYLLKEPERMKDGAGIFVGSMSDLMGHWTPGSQIEQVLDVCRRTPQHVYFLLTKNAPRLLKFKFPANVWVGVSSPPDFMFGKRLEENQKQAYLQKALNVLGEINDWGNTTWMSFEPLTVNPLLFLMLNRGALSWAVIGAASQGKKYIAPDENIVKKTVSELDEQGVPFFYKGNMKCLPWAVDNWRQEFPAEIP